MAWYEPDSFHITVGSVALGLITDTYTSNNIRHELAETTGTPSMDYEYWYAGVPGTVTHFRVKVEGHYDGNPSHEVEVYLRNFTLASWDIFAVMPSGTTDIVYYSPDHLSSHYVSGGQVNVRFLHPKKGINTHTLDLDQVVLEDRSSLYSTAPPTTIAPTTVAPSTLAPTTTLTTAVPTTTLTTAPPTTTLTTLAPTTAWGEDIVVDPIDIVLSIRGILHYNPPMPANPGLDRLIPPIIKG